MPIGTAADVPYGLRLRTGCGIKRRWIGRLRIQMKAAFIEQFGGPEVLKYGDLPDPVAAPGEVVVDVVVASINAADWKFRAWGSDGRRVGAGCRVCNHREGIEA